MDGNTQTIREGLSTHKQYNIFFKSNFLIETDRIKMYNIIEVKQWVLLLIK
jgi:hypothetical protein